MADELVERTVMITGASRGLGAGLARAFVAEGAGVVLCARSAADLERLARELVRGGGAVEWAAADVTDATAIGELVTRAERRFGGVDALVLNASLLGKRGRLTDQSLEEWRTVLDVNVTGAFVAVRAVLPGMRRRRRGSIISVSSGVGDRPRAEWGAYAVSKWALEALTWNLALEEGERGIRANVVDPGSMRTDMRRAAYPAEDPDTLPEPAAVTPVFLWLASDASAGTTGERFRAQDWP
jgi:NAD(P)-dependent dehydrogenase (short-subunit alcohol dehydrogenase family)